MVKMTQFFLLHNFKLQMCKFRKKFMIIHLKDDWIISHNNKTILEQLSECILQMKNPENGNAASSWIVNRLPRGADKVFNSEIVYK